jgi:hypothetical protein
VAKTAAHRSWPIPGILVNRGILMANGGDLSAGMLQHYYSKSMLCEYTVQHWI